MGIRKFLKYIWLGLLLFSSVLFAQQFSFTHDFETGNLKGWKQTGNAFVFQPTKGDNPTARHRGQPSNHQGRYWIGTYEKYQGKVRQNTGDIQGDKPTGTLTSSLFMIPSGRLSFLVGGGSSFKTRVELLILDPIEGFIRVKYASGRNTETMHREIWNLAPYAGRKGKIRIVDGSSGGWGHINVDYFRFSPIHSIRPPIGPSYPVDQRVEVPGLIGHPIHEAEMMIHRSHLKVGEIAKVFSGKKSGTVIRQDPKEGRLVSRGTPVNLWIAKKQEFPKPRAVIEPVVRRVKQGEIAVFESRSVHDPDGSIKEYWRGPDQKGEGHAFEVNTRHLIPGKYKIILEINDNHQQRDRTSATLYVDPAPIEYRLSFKVEPNQVIENQRTSLTATIFPSASDVRYRFDLKDGKRTKWIRENQIEHLYASPGIYHPSVEVRIGRKSIAKRARIEVKPIEYTVGLKADRQHTRVGEAIQFRGGIKPISENVRYRFYYGDGERSGWLEEPTASHTYSKPGLYHAYLMANIGERKLRSDEISIDVSQIAYILHLEAHPLSTLPGEHIEFVAILEPEAPNAKYRFGFGDGKRTKWIRKNQIDHLYVSPGIYYPSVEVKIGEQIIAKETTVEVRTIEYAVGLKANRQHVQVGEKVRFKGGIKPISENVQYRFFFGDDKNSGWLNEPVSDHTYANSGTYHAYLVARICERSFNSEKISIDVREIPYTLQLEANPSSTLLGEQIEFTALLEPEAPNARYQFDFSDGEPHTESGRPNAVHVYRTPGAYDVNVTVTIGQRSLSKMIRVTVQEKPDIWILIAAAGGALAVFGGSVYLYRRKPWKSKIKKPTKVVVTMQIKEGQANQNIDKDDLLNGIEVRFRPVGDAGMQEIEQKDNIVDRERSDHE